MILYLFTKRLIKLMLRQKSERSVELSSTKSITKSIATSASQASSIQSMPTLPSTKSIPTSPSIQSMPSTSPRSISVGYSNDMEAKQRQSRTLKRKPTEYSVSDVKSVQSNLTLKQTKLIFLITRCIILSSFALITTILFGFVLFYYVQFGIHIFIVYG